MASAAARISRALPATPYSWKAISPTARCAYIRDIDHANREIAGLKTDAVGFDLEWKPTFVKGVPENPVALVQIASSDTILLIQVSAMQDFPEKLREFLENPDVIKAGVSIQNDTKKLYKDWRVSTRSCVDLSLLARSADNALWKGKYSSPIGLARLVETYKNLALGKGKITRSNWEARLTETQQEYASNDAHAGFVIYGILISMTKAMLTVPDSVCYTFDFVRGRLCEPSGMQWYARNPDYDPGPPPPPRPPKMPTASNVTISGASTLPPSVPSFLDAGDSERTSFSITASPQRNSAPVNRRALHVPSESFFQPRNLSSSNSQRNQVPNWNRSQNIRTEAYPQIIDQASASGPPLQMVTAALPHPSIKRTSTAMADSGIVTPSKGSDVSPSKKKRHRHRPSAIKRQADHHDSGHAVDTTSWQK